MKKLLLFFMSLNFLVSTGQALSEGFEGTSVPDYVADDWVLGSGTWKVFDNGIGTVQSWREWTVASLVYQGLRSAYVQRENVTDGTFAEDWLVTPQVLVPADGQLRFYTRKALGGNFGTIYDVRISTASQTTTTDFIVLDNWDDATLNSNQTTPVYEQKVIDLTAYVGQNVYIAFVMTNDNGNRWLVDNVFVDSKCLDPTTQWVSAVNDTSVDLNWDNPSGASQWEIEWGPTGFAQGSGTLVTPVNSNPYTLPGLTAATTYDFYVRSVCPNDNYSSWIGPYTFTTAVCAIADQCDFDFVMTDTWGDGWNGATMQISQFGINIATIGPTFTAGNGPVTVTVPLCSDDPFQVVWTNGGGFPNEVGMSIVDPLGATIFTLPSNSGSQVGTTIFNGIAACTPPTCPQPSNVLVSGINTSSGTITWSDNTSGVPVPATQWQVIIQPAGSGYPPSGSEIINTTVSSTSYAFSGLSSDTQYEVYISAICDASGTPDPSYYEGPTVFTTSKDYCNGDLFTDSGGISGNYTGNEDTIWSICPENVGDVVTVFFNAFATQANFDGLYVYDGPNTSSPLIASANGAGNVPGGVPGSYWGNTVPGPFVSTHPSGCLTFRFRSNAGTNLAGWNANVVCGPPPPCTMPTNLQIISTTTSTVTLGWNENNTPPATSWQIVQQPIGSGYPGTGATIINANTNPFTLPAPSGPVEYYVRTDCGGDGTSYWTGPLTYIAGDDWEVAVPICTFDDYTGTTLASYNDSSEWPNPWPELSGAFCGSIENDSFFVFEATGTTINMNVNVACASGTGVQFMIFDAATMGSGPVNEINCYSPMNVGNNPLTFTGLTPGNTYYLMIDGYAGAVCDYTISLPDGSTTTSVNIIQESQDLCIGQSIVLDAEGGNGIYTWSPAVGLNATTGSQVTFTPPTPGVYTISVSTTQTSIVCDTSDSIVITVYDNTTPSFSNPGPLCEGSPNVTLDTTDANGISGTWTLSGTPVTEVDASTAGLYDYVFTPDPVAHPCSPLITMQVEIKAACTFGSYATAVYVDNCETTDPGEFFNISGSGTDLIGAPTNIYTSNDFGTYLQNSGNLMLKGAELRSFKTTTSNVCQVNMHYRVYETSTAPGAFNVIALSLLDDCVAGNFPSGGTCDPDDQKWQNLAESIDLTQNTPGNYTIEVYYELIGDNNSPTACTGDIELLNNAGNNYLAEFTIQGTLSFSQSNEECGSSNGSITISGFVPGDTYTVTYNDDTMPIAAADYQADFNGDITIINLDAGTYDNFEFVINGCSIFDATQVILTNFSPSITGVVNNSPICFGNNATFTIEGSPNFEVDYTINGGTVQTVVLDASGFATVTVVNPAVGSVDLALLNIHNSVCNIVVSNTSSVVVNPLPTATITAPVNYACIGSDASFVITGTPNATVTYSVNGGANQTIVLDASGNYNLDITTSVEVQVTLINVIDGTTSCLATISSQVANVAIIDVPEAEYDLTQPTCSNTTGTLEITSPLLSQLNFPGDLFISEVTDANGANVNYIEIYNGTGGDVDLSNYKLKVEANSNCEVVLSGILANDDTVVVKGGSGAPIAGVAFDFQFTSCTASVNNNDRYLLTSLSDVVIDQWGPSPTDPNLPNGVGYRYARNQTGNVLPSITWNPADWTYTDWVSIANDDYSDVGVYSLYAANYQYILNDGTNPPVTQSSTTFANLAPGTYSLVVHDTATNCYSDPLNVTINAVVFNDPVTTFTYASPVCEGSANELPDTSIAGFTGGGEFTATPAGLVIDLATGEIDVVSSTPGVYTITYAVLADAASCLNAGSSTFEFEITAGTQATFNDVTLCLGDMANTSLPTTSLEGFTGTWDAANIDTSVVGNIVYTFTPDPNQCASVGTLDVEVISKDPVSFTSIEVCNGATIGFPSTSDEGYVLSGTWSPSSISTSTIGSVDYTFTPDDPCYDVATLTVVTESCTIQKGISPNGDDKNDNFDLASYNVSKLEIFNRYGRKVYTKSNYVDEWYGQSDNGNDLPTGTYYYVIEFRDLPTKTGWIYINREE